MKISFKNGLHNCDKYLHTRYIRGCFNEPIGDVGFYIYCLVCKRIRKHIEYGEIFVEIYKPKKFIKE